MRWAKPTVTESHSWHSFLHVSSLLHVRVEPNNRRGEKAYLDCGRSGIDLANGRITELPGHHRKCQASRVSLLGSIAIETIYLVRIGSPGPDPQDPLRILWIAK